MDRRGAARFDAAAPTGYQTAAATTWSVRQSELRTESERYTMEWSREMPAMHQAMRRWEALSLRRRALYGALAAVMILSIAFFVTVCYSLC